MLKYIVSLSIFTSVYAVIALGLNLQWGITGLINLGQVSFMAIGAYTSALLTLNGVPFGVAVVAGVATAMLASLILAQATPRLREDYLAIVTLGFSEIVRLILLNETWIAGGSSGLARIPQPLRDRNFLIDYELFYAVLLLAVLFLAFLFVQNLVNSPLGRVLRAIREDEVVPESLGKNVFRFKTLAFSLGAGLAGLGGSFYAHYLTFIAPEMFTAQVSIYVLIAVLAGGRGSSFGVILGSIGIALLLEGTRFLTDVLPWFDGVQLASLRLIVVGIVVIALVLARPEGLSPRWAGR